MKTASLTICALFFVDLLAIARPQAMVKPSTDGRGPAAQWLRLMDDGRYAASWSLAAKSLQSRISEEEWITGMRKVRAFFGRVMSRKFENAAFDINPPGLPSGEYETIWYKIRLAIEGTAIEIVSMEREGGGKWRVRAFSIAPEKKLRFLPLQFLNHRRGKFLRSAFAAQVRSAHLLFAGHFPQRVHHALAGCRLAQVFHH